MMAKRREVMMILLMNPRGGHWGGIGERECREEGEEDKGEGMEDGVGGRNTTNGVVKFISYIYKAR